MLDSINPTFNLVWGGGGGGSLFYCKGTLGPAGTHYNGTDRILDEIHSVIDVLLVISDVHCTVPCRLWPIIINCLESVVRNLVSL